MQTIPAFFFDRDHLQRLAERLHPSFKNARPFEHVVLENLVSPEIMELLVREFPGPDDIAWEVHGPGRTKWAGNKDVDKLSCSDDTKFRPFTRHFMSQLNSAVFLQFLETLSGTKGIFPDPTYSHCGLHSTGRGGRLMMHTDVNRHPLGNLMHQYLNLIFFVNPDWKEEYGGHLEMWDDHRNVVQRVLPAAGKAVLFNAGTRSLHGHPHPLTCPEGRRRNSIAVYYYLRERPANEMYSGAQRAVRWTPVTPEDHQRVKEGLERGLARLVAVRGATVGVGLDVLPFTVAEELVDARTRTVALTFVDAAAIDVRAFAQAHARGVVAAHGGDAAAFFARYRPVAVLGPRQGDGALHPKAETSVVDLQNGELFVVRGPEAKELFWVGYLDEVLDQVERGR